MKRNLKFFVMLLLVGMLSSCSDDKTPITEEPPKENPTTPEEETTDEESALPVLTVVGRYLKNNKGEIVNFVCTLPKVSRRTIYSHGQICYLERTIHRDAPARSCPRKNCGRR